MDWDGITPAQGWESFASLEYTLEHVVSRFRKRSPIHRAWTIQNKSTMENYILVTWLLMLLAQKKNRKKKDNHLFLSRNHSLSNFIIYKNLTTSLTYSVFIFVVGQVVRGFRIPRLHLCRGVRLPQRVS